MTTHEKFHAQPDERALAEARKFASEIKRIFGDDLVEARLYGSCATGTNHVESDVDIALIVTPAEYASFSMRGDERSYACDKLEFETGERLGMPVSLLVWTEERLETERRFGTGFAKNLDAKSIDLLGEEDVDPNTTYSYGSDDGKHGKELAEKALDESFEKLLGCFSAIERGRWRTAHNDLYFALFHAAKAALFSVGKDPTTHMSVRTELVELTNRYGFPNEYIRFFGDSKRIRDISVYSYIGEVTTLGGEELAEALKTAYVWLEKTVDTLVVPRVSSMESFESLIGKFGLSKNTFFGSGDGR